MVSFSVFQPPAIDSRQNNKIQYINAPTRLVQALTLKNIAVRHKGTMLIVTHDTPAALNLEAELNYLLSDSKHSVALFPDRETLPYDNFSPHQDLVAQRLETLHHLTEKRNKVIIVPVSTLLVKLPPQKFITDNVLILNKGDDYDLASVRGQLIDTGYHAVEQVYEHGEFAVRGSIIDIYPTGSEKPLRIELFDDEVESIRYFNPETQRSEAEIESVRMLPAKEFPTDDSAIETFRGNYRNRFEKASGAAGSIYQQVSKKVMPAGIENYLPLFFDNCETLFDYLNDDSLLITIGDIESAIRKYLIDIGQRFEIAMLISAGRC